MLSEPSPGVTLVVLLLFVLLCLFRFQRDIYLSTAVFLGFHNAGQTCSCRHLHAVLRQEPEHFNPHIAKDGYLTLQFSEGTDATTANHQRKQLIPNLVDEMTRSRSGAFYAETPLSPTTYDKGCLKITYRALVNTINDVAWLLRDHLDEETKHDRYYSEP